MCTLLKSPPPTRTNSPCLCTRPVLRKHRSVIQVRQVFLVKSKTWIYFCEILSSHLCIWVHYSCCTTHQSDNQSFPVVLDVLQQTISHQIQDFLWMNENMSCWIVYILITCITENVNINICAVTHQVLHLFKHINDLGIINLVVS